jgi:hypothetical protein
VEAPRLLRTPKSGQPSFVPWRAYGGLGAR